MAHNLTIIEPKKFLPRKTYSFQSEDEFNEYWEKRKRVLKARSIMRKHINDFCLLDKDYMKTTQVMFNEFDEIFKMHNGKRYIIAHLFFYEREIVLNKFIATQQDIDNAKKAFPNYIVYAHEDKPYVDLSGQPMELARRQREIPL